MNGTAALLAAARGLQRGLGRIASPEEFVDASHMLDEIACELLRITNLELPDGEESVTAADLVREAALLRMRFLNVPAKFEEAVGCLKTCLPACRCTLRSLLLTDEKFVLAIAAKLQTQQMAAQAEALRGALGSHYNVGFKAGGTEFLFPGQPGPMDDPGGEDEEEES